VLYLGRDAVAPDASAYLRKQQDRAAKSLAWLDARVDPQDGLVTGLRARPRLGPLGLVEIALVTALDWMRFRQTYPIERHPNLTRMLAIHAERPSFRATIPRP